ncbi:hypothetical protein, partial [Aeromonas jandaei]
MNSAIQSKPKDEWIELLRPERRDEIERNAKKIIKSRLDSGVIKPEQEKQSISKLEKDLKQYDLFMEKSAPTIRRWISGDNVSSLELRKSILAGINTDSPEAASWGNDGKARVQGDSREFLGLLNDALLVKYTDGIYTATKLSSANLGREMVSQDPEPSCEVKVPVIEQNMYGKITKTLGSLSQAFNQYLSSDSRPEFKWGEDGTNPDTRGQIVFQKLPKKMALS